MILRSLLLGVVLIAAALLGLLILRDPGYVVVQYGNVAVSSSLWAALLAVAVIVVALSLTTRLLFRLFRVASGRRALRGRGRRGIAALQRQTGAALSDVLNADYSRAAEAFAGLAGKSDSAVLHLWEGAKAAAHAGNTTESNRLLDDARESLSGPAVVANELLRAQIQQQAGQWRQSLETLRPVLADHPKIDAVRTLMVTAYGEIGDWDGQESILEQTLKGRPKDRDLIEEQLANCWTQRLRAATGTEDSRLHVASVWEKMPKRLRQRPECIGAYASALIQNEQHREAEALLHRAIDKGFDDSLVELYGSLSASPGEQLRAAEKWLVNHMDNPVLLHTLGRICWKMQNVDQARQYLESSARISKSADVYRDLSAVYFAVGRYEQATKHLNRAIEVERSRSS